MRTRFSRVKEILRGRKRLVGRFDGGATLELVIKEKIEPPTTRIACDVGTEAAVEATPALGSMYVVQGKPDAASNAALGSTRRHLKFDLEEI